MHENGLGSLEPSEAMIEAGYAAWRDAGSYLWAGSISGIFKAMEAKRREEVAALFSDRQAA